MRQAYADGIGWGDAKQKLFERIDAEVAPLRERYEALIARPADIEATPARWRAAPAHCRMPRRGMQALREAVGPA